MKRPAKASVDEVCTSMSGFTLIIDLSVNAPKPDRSFNTTVVRRAKQGASCQVKDLMFQNLASRNYRVLQLC